MSDEMVGFIIAISTITAVALGLFWREFGMLLNKLRKPKYRAGQKVRVRTDLDRAGKYGGRTFWHSMMKHAGRVVTVKYAWLEGKNTHFSIWEDDENVWSDEMVEPFVIKPDDAFEALLFGHINDEEYKEIMRRERGWFGS